LFLTELREYAEVGHKTKLINAESVGPSGDIHVWSQFFVLHEKRVVKGENTL